MAKNYAKKRLGQNFLQSQEVIKKIVSVISPKPNETILEIGPGKGALTIPLAESGATILAVEFDVHLCRYLEKALTGKKNVSIIQKDFLQFIPAEYGLTSIKLCGNLPFNITSPVVEWIVHHRSIIKKAVLMIQREVALRLSSEPGGKDWSPLAIFTQLHFEINYLFSVSPKEFSPSPKVTSAVVELVPKESVEVEHYSQFEELVRASFKQRRKQLINNLVPAIVPTTKAAEEIFNQLGFQRNIRAEQIDTSQFLELTELLVQHNIL